VQTKHSVVQKVLEHRKHPLTHNVSQHGKNKQQTAPDHHNEVQDV
jgi:hypothetical protein